MRAAVFAAPLALAAALATACSSDQPTDDGKGGGDEGSSSSSSSSSGSSSSSSSSGSGEVVTNLHDRVQAIMNARCTGCHGGDMPDALLDLSDISALANAESFELPGQILVKPGVPDESVLVLAVEGNPPGALDRMPLRGAALPKTQTDAIRQWVEEGAE